MQKPKFAKISHTYIGRWVRVLLLLVFICGTQLIALISLHTHVKAVSTGYHAGIIKAQPHALAADFALQLVSDASSYTVGQKVKYTLTATNVSSSSYASGSISLVDKLIASGLSQIQVTGGASWSITAEACSCTSIFTAKYTGSYPIAVGESLSPITITGTLTPSALGSFANSAALNGDGDLDPSNNSASLNISVAPLVKPIATKTPTVATPTLEPTIKTTPTKTPVVKGMLTKVPAIKVPSTKTPTIEVTPTEVPTINAIPTLEPAIGVTPTEEPTMEVTPNVIPDMGQPDMGVAFALSNAGYKFQIGSPLVTHLVVSNASMEGSAKIPSSIVMNDLIPVGLGQITATGTNWSISLSSTTSPALLTATYNGPGPVLAGSVLPPITVRGVLLDSAYPQLTMTASVSYAGDVNLANNEDVVTVPVSLAPVITSTPLPLNLSLEQYSLGGSEFNVGQTVKYNLVVSNVSSAPVTALNPIVVVDVIPLGLSRIGAVGENWDILISNSTSPAVLKAVYTGLNPVVAGRILPPIIIYGTVTQAARPHLTTTAMLNLVDDIKPADNSATTTIHVSPPVLSLAATSVASSHFLPSAQKSAVKEVGQK